MLFTLVKSQNYRYQKNEEPDKISQRPQGVSFIVRGIRNEMYIFSIA